MREYEDDLLSACPPEMGGALDAHDAALELFPVALDETSLAVRDNAVLVLRECVSAKAPSAIVQANLHALGRGVVAFELLVSLPSPSGRMVWEMRATTTVEGHRLERQFLGVAMRGINERSILELDAIPGAAWAGPREAAQGGAAEDVAQGIVDDADAILRRVRPPAKPEASELGNGVTAYSTDDPPAVDVDRAALIKYVMARFGREIDQRARDFLTSSGAGLDTIVMSTFGMARGRGETDDELRQRIIGLYSAARDMPKTYDFAPLRMPEIKLSMPDLEPHQCDVLSPGYRERCVLVGGHTGSHQAMPHREVWTDQPKPDVPKPQANSQRINIGNVDPDDSVRRWHEMARRGFK